MPNASRDENNVPTLLAASSSDGTTPVKIYGDPSTHRLLVNNSSGGTVSSVSVVTANGLSGTVATATTTPAITLDISGLDASKIANGTVSSTEFQYLGSVTSDIQTQLNTLSSHSPVPLFDHFTDAGNVTTGETDLYSDIIPAGQLATNGDKIESEYGGSFVSSGTATREIKAYFGGTMIFDTGTLTVSLAAAWTMYLTVIRVSASVVRCMVSLTTEGAALAAYTAYTEVTGLTLTNTQVFKITGQAGGVGAATNDIVAKLGTVAYFPHA